MLVTVEFPGEMMAVTVQWDNEDKTVLRYDLAGRWTWDEFFKAFYEGKAMMADLPYIVHFITHPTDEASRGYLPPGALSHTTTIGRNAPANAGMTVAIAGGAFYRAIYTIGRRVYPRLAERYAFADTLEEAREIIAARMAAMKQAS